MVRMLPDTADNSSLALERLRALLGDLPPTGEARLPTERALAAQLGISRRSVRRALEVMEAEGLVWRRQGAGTFAGPRPAPREAGPGAVDPIEVMEVRLRVEPQIAQLAALRAGPGTVRRMEALIARLDATQDADERELWDSALHREIARAAGNRLFLTLFETIDRVRFDARWRAIRERARGAEAFRTVQDQHRGICAAIAAHDPVAAGAAMRAHIMTLNDNLLRQTSLEALADGG